MPLLDEGLKNVIKMNTFLRNSIRKLYDAVSALVASKSVDLAERMKSGLMA